MTALTPAATRRLLAVLELAERPGTEGERTGAEHAVGRLMLAHADAIRAVLTAPAPAPPARSPPAPPSRSSTPPAPAWRVLCDACMRHPRGLRRWEADFLRSLRGFPRCSPKQRAVLHAIAERIGLRKAP